MAKRKEKYRKKVSSKRKRAIGQKKRRDLEKKIARLDLDLLAMATEEALTPVPTVEDEDLDMEVDIVDSADLTSNVTPIIQHEDKVEVNQMPTPTVDYVEWFMSPNSVSDSTPSNSALGSVDISLNNDVAPSPLIVYEEKLLHENPLPTSRIICDLAFVIKQARELESHTYNCDFGGQLIFQKEKIFGLVSHWTYICSKPLCSKIMTVRSDKERGILNKLNVLGALSTGSGYYNQNEQFASMGIEYMNKKTYAKCEREAAELLKACSLEKMMVAIEEEKTLATEVDDDGMSCITAIVDGGWCKRSYGHGYNAASGVAVLIGEKTKKILFAGVRNKVCVICHAVESGRIQPKDHVCFKNWSGPSTAMEADIIVEGMRYLEECHGIRCLRLIGDGDSSTMAKVRQGVSYGGRVVKVECANHAVRRYVRRLEAISKDTKGFPGPAGVAARKLLINRMERLAKGARTAIKRHAIKTARQITAQTIECLKKELLLGPDHVFGNHLQCGDFCQRKEQDPDGNQVDVVAKVGMLDKLKEEVSNTLVLHAPSLLYNATNNPAEAFFGQFAKVNSGKRINHSKGGGINRRVHVAALAFQSRGQGWHRDVHKKLTNSSTPLAMRKLIVRRNLSNMRKCRLFTTRHRNRRGRIPSGGDASYGDNPQRADIDDNRMEEEKAKFLEAISVVANDQFEDETRGQSNSDRWVKERSKRISATHVKDIYSRQPTTKTAGLVKKIIYAEDADRISKLPSVIFGKKNEEKARNEYIKKFANGKQVKACGMYVSVTHPYVCASPDGLVDDSGLVEIKCLHTAESYSSIKETCLAKNNKGKPKHDVGVRVDKSGNLYLPKSHKYYFQMQCQMFVTSRKWCDLFLWCTKDSVCIRYDWDEQSWSTKILPKLTTFYFESLLPELIDPRATRSMELREPASVTKAIQDRANKGQNKDGSH